MMLGWWDHETRGHFLTYLSTMYVPSTGCVPVLTPAILSEASKKANLPVEHFKPLYCFFGVVCIELSFLLGLRPKDNSRETAQAAYTDDRMYPASNNTGLTAH